jgi:glutamate dehydrogenase
MHIVDELLRDQDDDPALREHLHAYFPAAVRTRFAEAIDRHPLRREIAATSAVNDLVNRNGATYAFRMMEETGASVLDVVHAHLAATSIGEVAPFWSDVCALDGRVDHAVQVVLLQEADRLVERMSRWLLRNQRRPIDVDAVVGSYHSDVMAVDGLIHATATGSDAEHLSSRYTSLVEAGVPEDVAARAARMELLPASLDIARLAQSDAGLVAEVAGVYFALADRLALGALRDRIVDLPRDDRWQSLARAAMRDDLNGEHAALTRTVLVETRASADRPSAERVEIWLEGRRAEVETHVRLSDEAAIAAAPGLATLSVVLRELRTLAGDR